MTHHPQHLPPVNTALCHQPPTAQPSGRQALREWDFKIAHAAAEAIWPTCIWSLHLVRKLASQSSLSCLPALQLLYCCPSHTSEVSLMRFVTSLPSPGLHNKYICQQSACSSYHIRPEMCAVCGAAVCFRPHCCRYLADLGSVSRHSRFLEAVSPVVFAKIVVISTVKVSQDW